MKKTILLSVCLLFTALAFAQTTPPTATDSVKRDTSWKHGGFISLSLAQTGFSNWAAGGQSTLAINGLFNGFINYKTVKTSWENSLDMDYGLVRLDDGNLQKSDDRLELNSKFGKQAKGNFFYSALLNFKTQFTRGYNYPDDSTVVSDFLTPAYLSLAIGMDWKVTPYFSVFLSPATGRLTIVNNQAIADAGTYGNEPAVLDTAGNIITHGKKVRKEFGAMLAANFQKDIFKNVNLLAKLTLFDNYTDKAEANRGNIDVAFDGLLTMKVNKFISASIGASVIYDHDILIPIFKTVNGEKVKVADGRRTQVKEMIGVGFAYKF